MGAWTLHGCMVDDVMRRLCMDREEGYAVGGNKAALCDRLATGGTAQKRHVATTSKTDAVHG